jgi:hypothetical protein
LCVNFEDIIVASKASKPWTRVDVVIFLLIDENDNDENGSRLGAQVPATMRQRLAASGASSMVDAQSRGGIFTFPRKCSQASYAGSAALSSRTAWN